MFLVEMVVQNELLESLFWAKKRGLKTVNVGVTVSKEDYIDVLMKP